MTVVVATSRSSALDFCSYFISKPMKDHEVESQSSGYCPSSSDDGQWNPFLPVVT